jgi:isopenicillin-N N-acyltransferase like protein
LSVPFAHVQARGSHRELGRAVGEAARQQVAAALDFYEEHCEAMSGLSFAAATDESRRYLPFARRYLPEYLDELEGMAEGAGQPLERLLVPNCAEELTCEAEPGKAAAEAGAGEAGRRTPSSRLCTAVAVSCGGRHVVGHNMDWYAVDVDTNILFDLTCGDGTRILTIAGAAYLPILGMTSHGLGYVGNSLSSNDNRVGVPNAFVRRWTLASRSVDEARERAMLPARARGSNHLFADARGRLCNVETSGGMSATREAEGRWLAHTNHYTAPELCACESGEHEESHARLAVAERLLAEGVARGDDPIALVTGVLRDHSCRPDSICGHADESEPLGLRVMTVASMICDLDEGRLHACAGAPCENEYVTFSL